MDEIDTLEAKLDEAPDDLAAIEAGWTAGARGWQLRLFAIYRKPSADHPRYTSKLLWNVQHGSEISGVYSLTESQWPEAQLANALGEALASSRRVPFYFPAQVVPDDQCARWWDRDRSHPCTDCGVALRNGFLGRPWPWPGACAACIDKRERAGGAEINVHIAGVNVATREQFAALRDPWFEAISGADIGLVKLVNVLSDAELWVMLLTRGREQGLDAALSHLRALGLLRTATVTVADEQGRFRRVWPEPRWSRD